jgi:hypothetical protein
MDIVIPGAIIGLIVAGITEILKISFFKNLSYSYQKFVAFLIAFLGVGFYLLTVKVPVGVDDILSLLITALVASYGIWKTIFKPIEVAVANYRIKVAAKKAELERIEAAVNGKESI